MSAPDLAALFWFYKQPDVCANHLELFRRRNEGVRVYGLYGGPPGEAASQGPINEPRVSSPSPHPADTMMSDKELFMPMYEFHCDGCDTSFDERVSINDRDRKVPCPKCNSTKTGRKLSVVGVGAAAGAKPGGGGHVHSGMCGCGKMPGSCGMN
jgi:putative FmdB family regulatory protein